MVGRRLTGEASLFSQRHDDDANSAGCTSLFGTYDTSTQLISNMRRGCTARSGVRSGIAIVHP
jgi:hypothetical protein